MEEVEERKDIAFVNESGEVISVATDTVQTDSTGTMSLINRVGGLEKIDISREDRKKITKSKMLRKDFILKDGRVVDKQLLDEKDITK